MDSLEWTFKPTSGLEHIPTLANFRHFAFLQLARIAGMLLHHSANADTLKEQRSSRVQNLVPSEHCTPQSMNGIANEEWQILTHLPLGQVLGCCDTFSN